MSLPDYLACLDGAVMPLSQVKISPLDRAFLFGDAIYEVLRVYGGKAYLADEHFQRLENSLAAIRIHGIDINETRRRMDNLLARANCPEAMVYIQITRGAAPRKHAFPKDTPPLELLWVQAYDDGPTAVKRQQGVGVITHPDLRWKRCDVKSVNLLGNLLANQAAAEADCDEALLYNDAGFLTEGSHSSFFAVIDGALVTTPGGNTILPGITRLITFRLAPQAGVAVREQQLHRHDVDKVQELFLTGTTSEVLPIVRVDGKPIAGGEPGPVTRALQRAFTEAVRQSAKIA